MLYAWDAEGNLREGFPINKIHGGNEGIISIADVDRMKRLSGFRLRSLYSRLPASLHAYMNDGSGEVEGSSSRYQC